MPTYYELLGVAADASAEAIKHAYYDIMKQHHPDRHGNQDDPIARLVNQAYAVLEDPVKRVGYDRFLGKTRANPIETKPVRQESPATSPSSPSAGWQANTNRQGTGGIAKCEWCDGYGHAWDNSVCIGCNGSGKRPPRPSRLGRLTIETPCRLCGGSGKNCLGIKCNECEGSGMDYLPPSNQQLCPGCAGWGIKRYEEKWLHWSDRSACNICNGNGLWPALQRKV